MTPYNHSTYYYNELLNSGRQVGDSFYAYVRGGLLLSVGFWRCFIVFLAPSDDSSSFCRLRWAILPLQASSMTLQMHLYGVQLLLPVVRDWSPHKWIARGSFARPLRLASLLWFLRTRLFASRLSDRGCWGKPDYGSNYVQEGLLGRRSKSKKPA